MALEALDRASVEDEARTVLAELAVAATARQGLGLGLGLGSVGARRAERASPVDPAIAIAIEKYRRSGISVSRGAELPYPLVSVTTDSLRRPVPLPIGPGPDASMPTRRRLCVTVPRG